jgi:hypothetical protein
MIRVLFCLTGMMLGLSGVAEAASPTPGALFRDPKGGESGGGFMVASSGKAIKAGATLRSNFKCNKLNAVVPRAIPISSTGAFSYSGPLKGQPGTATVTGKFTSAGKAVATTTIKNGTCSSGAIHWTATGSAAGGASSSGGAINYG